VVFVALLALIPLAAIPYGAVKPWALAIFECTVFALSILAIIEISADDNVDWREFKILLPLLALVVFAYLQTISFKQSTVPLNGASTWSALSFDPFETRRWLTEMLAMILFGAMLLRYTSSEGRLRVLVTIILLVGVGSALFGIVRQTTQREPGFLFLSRLSVDSGYAQYINKNHFAYLAEMALGLVLGFIVLMKKEKKLLYLALSVPLWAAIVLSRSRGGILSMFGEIVLVALLWIMAGAAATNNVRPQWIRRMGASRPVQLLLVVVLCLSVLMGTIWIGADPLASSVESARAEISQREASREGATRAEIWRSTLALIKDHWLVGVGFGGYWIAISGYHRASGAVTPQEAHNDYLELLASGGLVGVLLVAWFLLLFARRVKGVWKVASGYRKAAAFGALVGICGVGIHSLFDFGIHVPINAMVLAALMVIVVVGGVNSERGTVNGKRSDKDKEQCWIQS
jgi:O-antigen ligase